MAFWVSFRESTISLHRVKATLGADLSIAFYQIKNSTHEMLKQIGVNTNETQLDFLKMVILICSTKGAAGKLFIFFRRENYLL